MSAEGRAGADSTRTAAPVLNIPPKDERRNGRTRGAADAIRSPHGTRQGVHTERGSLRGCIGGGGQPYLDGKTGAQGGEKAHHLLHTKYKKLDVYKFEG